MNPLKLLILLAWLFQSRAEPVFFFQSQVPEIVRLIFDCFYYFLGILVVIQGLLMVLSSITMISGLFLKREVFILPILTLILIYFRSKNVYSIKRILNQYHLKLKTISNFVLCMAWKN